MIFLYNRPNFDSVIQPINLNLDITKNVIPPPQPHPAFRLIDINTIIRYSAVMQNNVADLTEKTYDIVRMVPWGRVTTYGHIAKLAGYPTYSRWVKYPVSTHVDT